MLLPIFMVCLTPGTCIFHIHKNTEKVSYVIVIKCSVLYCMYNAVIGILLRTGVTTTVRDNSSPVRFRTSKTSWKRETIGVFHTHQYIISPHEAVVQLEGAGVGNSSIELVTPMKVIERPEAQEIHVHIHTPVSEQNLGSCSIVGKSFNSRHRPILSSLVCR